MRRRRWRTIILVTGTTLCVLIAAAFVASTLSFTEFQVGRIWWVISAGAVSVQYEPEPVSEDFFATSWNLYNLSCWNMWEVWPPYSVQVPLYAVFLAVAAPTLLVWRFGPKPPRPGHCAKCGYNLTGNVSGRCPECGEAVE